MPIMYNFQHQQNHQQHSQQHQQHAQHSNNDVAHHPNYSSLHNSPAQFAHTSQNGVSTPGRNQQPQINEHWAEQLKLYKETERAHTIMIETHAPNHYARTKGHENRSIQVDEKDENGHDRGRPLNQDGLIRRQDWLNMDISGQGLRVLTAPLFAYTFLNELYIASNKITHIPASIGKLRQLRYLDASNNQLADLPPEIGMCVYLKHLLLFDNQLHTLPNELGSLYQLEMLGIEGNPLDSALKREIMDNGTKSLILHLREAAPIPPQPHPRQMLDLHSGSPNSDERVRVFSYNTLCYKMATPQLYGYTPSGALAWSYRKNQILTEIQNSAADFLCLQEVDSESFREFFSMKLAYHNYKGVFWPKSRARTMTEKDKNAVDGCATFYKSDKWILLDKQLVDFANIAINRPDMKNQHDIFNRVMPRDNISVITFFENRQTGTRVVVVNAHIYWDPAFADVKIIQTAILMDALAKVTEKYARWPECKDKKAYGLTSENAEELPEPQPSKEYTSTTLPILLCGDFNSTPDSAVYTLLSSGSLPSTHPELHGGEKDHAGEAKGKPKYQYGNFSRDGMAHPFSLKSSYSNLEGTGEEVAFTNYTPGFTGVLDYVWYSTNSLENVAVLGGWEGMEKGGSGVRNGDGAMMVAGDEPKGMRNVAGWPHWWFPSDHLSLCSEFVVKRVGAKKDGKSKR